MPTARGAGTWTATLAGLVAARLAIPLVAVAAEGRKLPAIPRFDYEQLMGDATGYYAAAREFMAAWGRLPPVLVAALALLIVALAFALVLQWQRRPERRALLVAGAAVALGAVVALGVSRMEPPGAPVFGWPLIWSLPMLPYRALGLPLDVDGAYGLAVALSLAANAAVVVATAYAGFYATGRRAVGLGAAALFALWPLLTGLVVGERAWENGTWRVDAGLHAYTEPLSTALMTVALAVLLRSRPTPVALAVSGVALGLATTVKLSNGIVAALACVLVLVRRGPRAALPMAAAGAGFVPVVLAYWPLSYYDESVGTRDELGAGYLASSWTESLLYTPRLLLALVPLAVVGAVSLRRSPALLVLLVWVVPTAIFYSFYEPTAQHPRFLFASLPAVFVLWSAGAAFLLERAADLARRAPGRPSPAR
jgi:hypothetical protein